MKYANIKNKKNIYIFKKILTLQLNVISFEFHKNTKIHEFSLLLKTFDEQKAYNYLINQSNYLTFQSVKLIPPPN